MATVFDENLSWYLDDNIRAFTTAPATVKKEDEGFMESNKMHCRQNNPIINYLKKKKTTNNISLFVFVYLTALNGFVYRNLPGLTMCKGDKVTWHLSGLGSEVDINSLYFEGNRFIYLQNRRDSISVFPHISHTVTMEPDSMGTCQTQVPDILSVE